MDVLFDGGGWKITREDAPLPGGRTKSAMRLHRPDGVTVIASPSPGRVLLLREFRPIYGREVWGLPSGKMEADADPAACARRELREEAGYDAGTVRALFRAYDWDAFDFAHHVYEATDLRRDPLPPDDDEFIEVHEFALEEAIEKALSDPMTPTITSYALLRYARETA